MPTEREWEKAARGVDGRLYPWGNTFDCSYANTQCSNKRNFVRVNDYPNGQSIYGVYNMAGNVAEWTSDIFKQDRLYYYYYVIRGSSFESSLDGELRISTRMSEFENITSDAVGFRCAKSAAP